MKLKIEKEEILLQVVEYFKSSPLQIEKVWLFGSFARNEQTPDSDLDLMVQFTTGSKADLWDFAGIKLDLEDLLGIKIDIVRQGVERPFAKKSIQRDKTLIYDRKASRQRAVAAHT